MFLNSFDIENIENIHNAKKKTPYQKLYDIYSLFENNEQLEAKLNEFKTTYNKKNEKRMYLQDKINKLKKEYIKIKDINELNKKDIIIFETSRELHYLNNSLFHGDKFYEIKDWTLKNNQYYTEKFLDDSFYKDSLHKLELLMEILKSNYNQ